ncbi:hypothetical protein JQC72_04675 [Polycladomyces sp. WAk]|uniref:Uncharacterized protein n=1 Tax=Polycladomyces zharkentensis TaxID=2807616 RepID=A0ABS2WH09_9BACL|nr:hypothetical protein [Polycladomyces sp. WAk]MBN2908817.1 hypothetical protein [Polycladomyces sp. WAk]
MRKCIVVLLLMIFLVGCNAEFMDREPDRLPVIPTHDHGHSFTYKGKIYTAQAVLGVPSSQLGEPVGRVQPEDMVVYRIKGLSEEWLATQFEGTPTVYTSKKGINLQMLAPREIIAEDTTPIVSYFTDDPSIRDQTVIARLINRIVKGRYAMGKVEGKIRNLKLLSFVSSRYPGIRYQIYYTERLDGQTFLDDNVGRVYPGAGSMLKPYLD